MTTGSYRKNMFKMLWVLAVLITVGTGQNFYSWVALGIYLYIDFFKKPEDFE